MRKMQRRPQACPLSARHWIPVPSKVPFRQVHVIMIHGNMRREGKIEDKVRLDILGPPSGRAMICSCLRSTFFEMKPHSRTLALGVRK